MTTKIAQLRDCASAQDWRGALRIAARFPSLGEHKAEIVRAHEAYSNPGFYRQIGRDPDELIAAGVAALKARYRLA